MKAAMFSVHRFERKVFDNANREGTHEIAYIAAALDATTVPLAEGCAAAIPSPTTLWIRPRFNCWSRTRPVTGPPADFRLARSRNRKH
jgi:hypothetical protein